MQLERDAQVQIHIEGIVVGDKRLGRCPTRDSVKNRRLDLDEASVLEEPAHGRNGTAAGQQDLTTAIVGPHVRVTLAVPSVDVGNPTPFVGKRTARFSQ